MSATTKLKPAGAFLLGVAAIAPAALAAPSVPEQLNKLSDGTTVKVRMADGKTVRGQLVSRSASSFDVVPAGDAAPTTIDDADVKTIRKSGTKHHTRDKVVSAVSIGSFFGLLGTAIAVAGFVI